MTRIERLRSLKGWTQPRMAAYLGVRQATVSRLESGQPESGPVARLLDLLESEPAISEPAAPCAAEPNSGAVPEGAAALPAPAAATSRPVGAGLCAEACA